MLVTEHSNPGWSTTLMWHEVQHIYFLKALFKLYRYFKTSLMKKYAGYDFQVFKLLFASPAVKCCKGLKLIWWEIWRRFGYMRNNLWFWKFWLESNLIVTLMESGQYSVSLNKDPYWSIIWANKSLLLHISGYFYFLLHVYEGEK